ncbi:unnamed protein product [Brachionus calyciflorus]|uniref:ubiquitinyl hydrolase 1 n=1 Tax=Brachionus calyciflorus TaxID=104777 RepID=A0A813QVM6_9BILA|nr:unnamed protein product [Brachionus calyciflorus]
MTSETNQEFNFYEDELIDEKIAAQQTAIEKEIANEQKLVGDLIELNTLLNEYLAEDTVYRSKITELSERFRYMRKTRGDGNCFFRAFAFRYFETLMGKPDEINKLKDLVNKFTSDLSQLGYNSFTVDDFKDVFIEELEKLNNTSDIRLLEEIFNNSGSSDYIVVFLRLIVSCYLQNNSDFYLAFLETYQSMKDFCSHEVEPMYRESDHIHIIALTNALEIPVGIIYLDRADQEKATPHNFPDDSNPNIFILYRPGHYDIIYRN